MRASERTPLRLPSRHWEWLVLPHGDRLHRIAEVDPRELDDGGQGTSLCGRSGRFEVPGFLSRMYGLRCARCCDLLGIPRGQGNTLNAGIEEEAA
jgi:hypothetical protein